MSQLVAHKLSSLTIGAKSDDLLSPYRVPSASKKRKRKREKDRKDRYERMKNKRVQKKLSWHHLLRMNNSVCKGKTERLQSECYALREENQKLKDIIKSGKFDELAFEKRQTKKVKPMTGIPWNHILQVAQL